MLASVEHYRKACRKLREAILKVENPGTPKAFRVFMGKDCAWNPIRQLKANEAYYSFMHLATECMGAYHVLHSLYHALKAKGQEGAYCRQGGKYLLLYADSLEKLDRFCETMYAAGMIMNHKYGTYVNGGEKLACVAAVRNYLAKQGS